MKVFGNTTYIGKDEKTGANLYQLDSGKIIKVYGEIEKPEKEKEEKEENAKL